MKVLPKKILMFDDDPVYAMTIRRQADVMNVEATVCRTMEDFCLKALEGNFDAVLIDYHLEHFKGDVVARVIENRPVVLMSNDEGVLRRKEHWPKEVVGFASKNLTAQEVISTVLGHVI